MPAAVLPTAKSLSAFSLKPQSDRLLGVKTGQYPLAWAIIYLTPQSPKCRIGYVFRGSIMSIASEIKHIATKMAVSAQHRLERLQEELAEVETRKTEIEAQLNAARLAPERVFNFQPQIARQYQCPRCWIEREVRSEINPIPSDTSDDLFRCRICHFEITI